MTLRTVVLRTIAVVAIPFWLSGCTELMAKTNMLSDERVLNETSARLGYQPHELTIVNKRVYGGNTYVDLKATDGKEFNCRIVGGNLFSMGVSTPPICSKKGETTRFSSP